MRMPARLALLLAVVAALAVAGCSDDDDTADDTTTTAEADGADTGGGDPSSDELDASCLPDDPEASTSSTLREYTTCALEDEGISVTGASVTGDPASGPVEVVLSAAVDADQAVLVCETAAPVAYGELDMEGTIEVTAIEDDGSRGAVLATRDGADGTCDAA